MNENYINNEFLFCYHDIIESIVTTLEAKDQYTGHHSRRVSDMVERLCKIYGINNNLMELIHMAAHVHDIGKIGIPDAVLLKKTRLNDNEWKLMQSHPTIGAKILSSSSRLSEMATIVKHHHERWDGNGYPNKIVHNAIPLGSRMIAVCDSIDAMLSSRPYRKPLSILTCKQEILNNKSLMYDPDIADCLLENWDIIVFNEKNNYLKEEDTVRRRFSENCTPLLTRLKA
jgi:putative nucleotidyltransferase with HDIG domain